MSEPATEPVKSIFTPVRLEYDYTAGAATSRFLHGVAQGRILGQRCPRCKSVYVPPRGSCARCGVATTDEVEVSHTGTVTSFCIVRIPSENLSFSPPFVCAHVVLDGADLPFFHVLSGCPLEDVRMGMRVKAAWVPPDELSPSLMSIRCFEPTDEPDADYDSYKDHL